MPNWAIVLIGFFGVIIGAVITFLIHWWERKERYQVLTFEKRLEAHQQAYTWCLKIGWLLAAVDSVEYEKVAEIHDVCKQAIEWYEHNLLYIDNRSRKSMLAGLRSTLKPIDEMLSQQKVNSEVIKDTLVKLDEAMACIVKGIGGKYLPKLKQKLELPKR